MQTSTTKDYEAELSTTTTNTTMEDEHDDGGDIWKSGRSKSELSDTGYPNTKSRRNGQSSGIRIYDFSENDNAMSFSIKGV
jgi:hypothetical protein